MSVGNFDKKVMEAHGIDEKVWSTKTPIEKRKMRDAYRAGKVTKADPSGQKTIHNEAQEQSADKSMQNLVDKGKMTQQEKDTKMELGERAQEIGTSPKEQENAPLRLPKQLKEEKQEITEVEKPETETPETEEIDTTSFDEAEQEQAVQEVQSLGITEDSSPQDAINAFLNSAVDNDIIEMDEDGNWKFKPFDSKKSSILRGIGTALSILLAIATGGQTPPINFYNVRSTNELDAKERYDELQNSFTKILGKIQGTEAAAAYSKAGGAEKAKEAEKVLNSGREREADLQNATIDKNFANTKALTAINFNNSKEMAKLQNELTKALVKYQSDVSAKQLIKSMKEAAESGYTLQEIADYVQRAHGQTAANAAADTVNKFVGAGTKVVETGAAIASGTSDGRYKKFKNVKKREYISKDRR